MEDQVMTQIPLDQVGNILQRLEEERQLSAHRHQVLESMVTQVKSIVVYQQNSIKPVQISEIIKRVDDNLSLASSYFFHLDQIPDGKLQSKNANTYFNIIDNFLGKVAISSPIIEMFDSGFKNRLIALMNRCHVSQEFHDMLHDIYGDKNTSIRNSTVSIFKLYGLFKSLQFHYPSPFEKLALSHFFFVVYAKNYRNDSPFPKLANLSKNDHIRDKQLRLNFEFAFLDEFDEENLSLDKIYTDMSNHHKDVSRLALAEWKILFKEKVNFGKTNLYLFRRNSLEPVLVRRDFLMPETELAIDKKTWKKESKKQKQISIAYRNKQMLSYQKGLLHQELPTVSQPPLLTDVSDEENEEPIQPRTPKKRAAPTRRPPSTKRPRLTIQPPPPEENNFINIDYMFENDEDDPVHAAITSFDN